MNCHKFRDELMNLLLFSPHLALPPALHTHLMECSSCREWWEKEKKLEEWLQANIRIQPVFLTVPLGVRKKEVGIWTLLANLLGIYYAGFLLLLLLSLPYMPFFFRLLTSIPIFPLPWWVMAQYLLVLSVSLWIVALFSIISVARKYAFTGVKG